MPEYKQKYTAKEARAFVDKRKEEEKKHVVPRVLNYIQDKVYEGATQISLAGFGSFEEYHFVELEELGFKVVRPLSTTFISMDGTQREEQYHPGCVSW